MLGIIGGILLYVAIIKYELLGNSIRHAFLFYLIKCPDVEPVANSVFF